MGVTVTSAGISRFLRRQQSYIAVAVAIYAALWAADRRAPLGPTLVYTLFLCNFLVIMQDRLGFLYSRRRPLHLWAVYSVFLLAVAVAGVVLVNLIQYPGAHFPGQTLWQFEESGWKFPFIATVIFGVSFQLYRATKDRLERKNRELQQAVDLEVAERELQGQELQQALEIQQSLLPKEIPQVDGFEIAGAWEPARVVGGDYYDVIKLGRTKLGICIADVVGKSVSAALLMANVQATLRAFASEATLPSALCTRVNSVLCANIAMGKFVTLFYGVLDAERHEFLYTNAGHLLPILIRAGGEATELVNGGAVLGVFPAWRYEDSVVQLSPGDRLLLFTDGITEAALPGGEEFGEQRLVACARTYADKSASELKSCLLADVKQFCASQLADDVTLIVVSALPSDGATQQRRIGACTTV
ncbi:MAG TPA: PP2C family protein-serine/threonine phosphatase [Candidatus Sulfotelmatobacter sp.]|nr:PP2C family protein-serine/threonine phosphatase [Candidatus Sulfotelmatobacter sp.]